MIQKEHSELTDTEPLAEAKKKKSTAKINALLIGVLIGIIIYSAVNNSIGFLTLIPLFFIYKLVNQSKGDKDLK